MFKTKEKHTLLLFLVLLALGSVMIIVSLSLEQYNSVLKYSMLPIIGSLALTRAATILIIDMPALRANKWILKEMEKRNVISFEYNKAE